MEKDLFQTRGIFLLMGCPCSYFYGYVHSREGKDELVYSYRKNQPIPSSLTYLCCSQILPAVISAPVILYVFYLFIFRFDHCFIYQLQIFCYLYFGYHHLLLTLQTKTTLMIEKVLLYVLFGST